MDDHQKKHLEKYAKLAQNTDNVTVMAGRRAEDAAKEEAIWNDILQKLGCKTLAAGSNVLDIGCSAGYLTRRWIEHARAAGATLFLNDIPEVIERVRKDILQSSSGPLIQLCPGIFPTEFPSASSTEKFDFIVIYSVLHYTSDPALMIDRAVDLLKPGGKLLVGDIPNTNRKGRFLASEFGRKFEASYRSVPLSEVPSYLNHHEFVSQYRGSPAGLNDQFMNQVLSRYRYLGYDAFVLPQPTELPFSFTREDLLICKND